MSAASPLDRTFRQIARDHRKFRRRLDRLERWDVDDYEVGGNLGTMDDAPNDGSADVTAAFEEAIENLADEGGKLEIPAGTYRMDSGLVVTKKLKLVGEGSNRTIISVNFAAGDLLTLSGAGSKVEGITFQAAVSRTSGAFLVLNATDIVVEDCELADYLAGISLLSTCTKCAIRGCQFRTNNTSGTGYGIWVRGAENAVRHCRFIGTLSGSATLTASYPQVGVVIGGGGGSSSKTTVKECTVALHRYGVHANVTAGDNGQTAIEDCRVHDYGINAYLIQPEAGQVVDDVRLFKCSADLPGPANADAFRINSSLGVGIRSLVLRECKGRAGTLNSYGLYAEGATIEDLSILGGSYSNNQQSGVYVTQHAAGSQVKVHGVRAKNNGAYGLRFGAGVIYDLKNNELGGNGAGKTFDNDLGGPIGGRGKRRKKQSAGNYPDDANDEFDGLELMDDGTDQTVTLQAIIDALPPNGGTIRLPEGSFTLVGQVNVNKAVRFIGKGKNATRLLNGHATSRMFDVTADRVIFRDLSIRAAVTRTAGDAIAFNPGADHGRVTDCYFENQWTAILNYGWHGEFSELQVASNTAGEQVEINGYDNTLRKSRVEQTSGTRQGSGVWLGLDETVQSGQNKVHDVSVWGFDVGIWGRKSESGTVINDDQVSRCNQAIRFDPSTGVTNNGTKVINCDLDFNSNYGVVIERGNGGAILNLTASSTVVTGAGSTAIAGFLVTGSAGTIRNVTLRGCKVEGVVGTGYLINAAISDWKITDCLARSNGGWGLDIAAGNTAYSRNGNRFKNNVAGNVRDLSTSTDRQGKGNDPDDVNVVLRCRAHHSVNQAVVTGTALWTWVEFNTEDEDAEGMHPTNADNAQFQIKTAGVYSIHFEGNFEQNSDGHRKGRIVRERLGSQTRIAYKRRAAVGGDRTTIDLHCKRRFQANDIVMVQVSQNSGVTLNLETEGGAGESTADIGPTITIEKVEG
jgi:hypothetical protein